MLLWQNGHSVNEKANREDTELSERGREHSRKLAEFIKDRQRKNYGETKRNLEVWTSTRVRSIQTAEHFSPFTIRHRSQMVEINRGDYDGSSAEDIKAKYPDEYKRHEIDPYHHRFPRAESYLDVSLRLESVILEMEHLKDDLLIIGHLSILRCLYAYLTHIPESVLIM